MEQIKESFELISRQELEERRLGLQKRMQDRGLDLCLIYENVNVYYFTGSLQRGFFLVPSQGTPVYLIQKHAGRARLESPVPQRSIKGLRDIAQTVNDMGWAQLINIGLELQFLPVSLFYKIQELLGHKHYTDIYEDIMALRARKSTYEQEQIRKSGQIVDHVFSKVTEYLRPGMKEIELAGHLQAEGRRIGHQEIMRMRGLNQELTNPHILSGRSGSVPSFIDSPLCGYGTNQSVAQGSSHNQIKRDEPVIIDYGGGWNGYCSDETRLFVLGRLDPELYKAYTVSKEILELVQEITYPGVNARDVYERVLDYVKSAGLQEHFMGYGPDRVKFIGHGIGLVINEYPILAQNRDEIIQEGMVIAVEPKFVFPQKGAVGLELNFVIRKSGLQRITEFPTDIVAV